MLRQPYVLSSYPPGGPLDGNTTVAVRGRGLAAVRVVRFGDARGEVVRRGAALVVRSPPQWPKGGAGSRSASKSASWRGVESSRSLPRMTWVTPAAASSTTTASW